MSLYRMHFQNVAMGVSFGIVVDSEKLTWTSDPPGNDIPQPMDGYFTGEDHSIGSGKRFEIFPGGRARFVGDGHGGGPRR